MLRVERAAKLGDPVRGNTTPFVQSFDTALPPQAASAADIKTDNDEHLNFYLSKDELEQGVAHSKWLTHPLPVDSESSNADQSSLSSPEETAVQTTSESLETEGPSQKISSNAASSLNDLLAGFPLETDSQRREWQESNRNVLKELTPEEREKALQDEHDTAQEALKRISSLALGSSSDRLRINKQRCIDVFGRHNTDQSLPPRAKAAHSNSLEKGERVGPDTGSSEVQVAILTAKIRALADFLETRGTTDKHGKRDLRLLVHRRAKLLKYLRRKERGGPRWQHLIDTLGLTEGTWQGEITL